jgi:hypothetical protein
VKVKDLVEVALLYVGIPAVALYPLGFVGLLIQLWRDDFFPYQNFNTIWNAVAPIPNTVVVGTGIELLYLSLVSTLVGLGVASLTLNFLHRRHAYAEEPESRRSLWSLYLLVLCLWRRSCSGTACTCTSGTTCCSWPASWCSPRGEGFCSGT